MSEDLATANFLYYLKDFPLCNSSYVFQAANSINQEFICRKKLLFKDPIQVPELSVVKLPQ